MCLTIFFARIMDVSLATVKTIFVIKGKKLIASLIAFFEISIWFLIAKDVLSGETNIYTGLAYCFGFAAGTFVGVAIEKMMAIGNLTVQAIITLEQQELISILRDHEYAVTEIDCRGRSGQKIMLLIEAKRRDGSGVKKIVQDYDKNIFLKITDTNSVFGGYFNKTR